MTSVRRWAKPAIGVALAVGLVALAMSLLGHIHARTTSGHWETPLPPVALGTIIGLTYGLLGVGLVLVYRTNRIINFAHGEIGAFGAAFFGLAVVRWHVPYWIAFPAGLAVGGAIGAAAEAGVVRRLRKAPRLMSVVATLGVGELVFGVAHSINATAGAGFQYPSPSGLPTFRIGGLLVTRAYTGMLVLGPVLVVSLIVFLRRSRFGLGLRAAAAAPDTARMAGVFASRMSSLAWAIAGGLSAFTAILTQPTQGFSGAQSFGPPLLLRALAAAAIGRMTNIAGALAAGIALGIVEQLLLWNFSQAGIVDVVLFAIILLALVVQRTRVGREDEERGSWAAVQALRPLPKALREIWLVRNLGTIVGVCALALAACLPLFITHSAAATLSGIFALAVVASSLGIVTGLGGQLSIGQFAIAAVGAVVSYRITAHGGNFVLAFLYAGLVAAAVSLLLGLPAVRGRGLMLTVTTLAFALVTPTWLLERSWMLGGGVSPAHPRIFGITLDTGRSYYGVALATLVLTMLVARNVRRGGFGRILTSVRDNEDNARAFTVRAARVKAQAFLLAGFLAGIGGALYTHELTHIDPVSFPTATSIDLVVMTVIGGLGIVAGPLLGALFVIALPAFVPLDAAGLAATRLGQLLIILYLPGGIAQVVEPVRDRAAAFLARRSGRIVSEWEDEPLPAPTVRVRDLGVEAPAPTAGVMLDARGLRKSYGGLVAVSDVSLQVMSGETLGLIGPNGAGKTTTFELLSGFVPADAGTVVFDGDDVTTYGPEARAQLGLVRSFQDSGLFPTLTVLESVAVALERVAPTRVLSSIAFPSASERAKQAGARDIVSLMGLDGYRDLQIQELSTGTRRIAEMACLVATRPKLLLFDEPSTGIAQRETEALGDVIQEIKRALGVTLVVIEHDMPLITGIADRIVAMADGRVIASGSPRDVQRDPLVVEAYLGGSLEAIQRSGAATASPNGARSRRRVRRSDQAKA